MQASTVLAGGALAGPTLPAPKEKEEEKADQEEIEEAEPSAPQQQAVQAHANTAAPPLDDFTRLLIPDDARLLIDLLKLAVSGRAIAHARECLSSVLSSLGAHHSTIGDMLLELCVTELEDVATDTERAKAMPQPVTQESSHPYTGMHIAQCTALGVFSPIDFSKLS